LFNSRLQPTEIGLGTSSSDSSLLKLDYEYGTASANNGNITKQTITVGGNAYIQTYSYDSLNRLSVATETGNWTQTYDHDRYGNRAVRATSTIIPNPQQTPTSNSPADLANLFNQARNRIQVAGYSYDEAGNLESDPTTGPEAMTCDGENRMVTYPTGGTTTYFYDGDGRRVKKVTGGVTVVSKSMRK
jgi:hypothetical protein